MYPQELQLSKKNDLGITLKSSNSEIRALDKSDNICCL